MCLSHKLGRLGSVINRNFCKPWTGELSSGNSLLLYSERRLCTFLWVTGSNVHRGCYYKYSRGSGSLDNQSGTTRDKVLYLLFCFRIRFKNRSCGLVNGTKRDPKHSSPCKRFTVLKNQPQEQILQQETFPAAKLDVLTLTLVIRLHEGSSKCVGE